MTKIDISDCRSFRDPTQEEQNNIIKYVKIQNIDRIRYKNKVIVVMLGLAVVSLVMMMVQLESSIIKAMISSIIAFVCVLTALIGLKLEDNIKRENEVIRSDKLKVVDCKIYRKEPNFIKLGKVNIYLITERKEIINHTFERVNQEFSNDTKMILAYIPSEYFTGSEPFIYAFDEYELNKY